MNSTDGPDPGDSQVAELAVYLRELGIVVRCRSCHTLLMAFTRIRGVSCVDLTGL
jgi:hypothetical protein